MLVVAAVFLVRVPILTLRGRFIIDAEPFVSIVEKLLFLVATIVIWWAIGVFIERHPLTELGLGKSHRLRGLGIGLLLGAVLICSLIGFYAIAGWYHVSSIKVDAGAIAAAVFLLSVTALFEEILFRGLLFRFVEELSGSWPAIGLTSLLFAAAHIQNPASTYTSFVALTISGAVFCLAFIATRSIWLVTGLHIGWNVGEAVGFGVPVSGVRFPSLLVSQLDGPQFWTGGAFGPEASAPCAAISLVAGTCFAIYAVKQNSVIHFFTRRAVLRVQDSGP